MEGFLHRVVKGSGAAPAPLGPNLQRAVRRYEIFSAQRRHGFDFHGLHSASCVPLTANARKSAAGVPLGRVVANQSVARQRMKSGLRSPRIPTFEFNWPPVGRDAG